MRAKWIFGALAIAVFFCLNARGFGDDQPTPEVKPTFKKMMVLIFENIDYQDALSQPSFARFARDGALLKSFYAEVHPSQGNYVALVAGDTYGVLSDDVVNLDVRHLGDLLEARGKNWKVYAEGYPAGGCFTGATTGTYARKHNPFMSFTNVSGDPARCAAHVVPASELQTDMEHGTVPEFSLYVPDMNNDGHDTGVAFADRWFGGTFMPLLKDPRLMQDMVVVASFDESSFFGGNHIYTALYGDSVIPGGSTTTRYDHFSLLRTIEDTLDLGTLGQKDAQAVAISGIWR
jgi:hypothetical protein